MRQLSECPLCHSKEFKFFISCEDFTVSHETFRLEECEECGFVFTNPQPNENELPAYYNSSDYISHSDRSSNLIDKLYKFARNYTLQWKYGLVQEHHRQKPHSILDFGCGTGAFLKECQKNQVKVSGVEPSAIARESAMKNTGASIVQTTNELRHHFDVITLWHVLEHVPDLNQTLSDLKRLLAENGTMFIALPNLKSEDAKRYQQFWAAFDVPRHLWHFSKKTMSRALEHQGLHLADVVPMKLDAYYVSLLSEKYKRGSNNPVGMASALLSGWNSNRVGRKDNEYSSLIYIARK